MAVPHKRLFDAMRQGIITNLLNAVRFWAYKKRACKLSGYCCPAVSEPHPACYLLFYPHPFFPYVLAADRAGNVPFPFVHPGLLCFSISFFVFQQTSAMAACYPAHLSVFDYFYSHLCLPYKKYRLNDGILNHILFVSFYCLYNLYMVSFNP